MTLTGIMAILIVALFSVLAFWRPNAILFMMLAAVSLMTGFAMPDLMIDLPVPMGLAASWSSTTELDITLAMSFIIYGFLCAGLAFRTMLWREER